MSVERSRDDALRDIRRRIDCPVLWCSGRWLEHGGDGQGPEDWVHDDEQGYALPHGAELHRSQIGAGPVEWTLNMRGEGASFTLELSTPAKYARRLRDIADEIDACQGL